jgi:hypothetical protein
MMPEHDTLRKTITSTDGAAERRAWVRYPCEQITSCQGALASRGKDWPTKVLDVSPGGIALVLERRFEPGTLLQVQLRDQTDQSTWGVYVRVVRITAAGSGRDDGWLVGCEFARPLNDEELRTLLAEAATAEAGQ